MYHHIQVGFSFEGKNHDSLSKIREVINPEVMLIHCSRPALSPVYRGMYREVHSVLGMQLTRHDIVRGRQR
jgi:hypothetical protein